VFDALYSLIPLLEAPCLLKLSRAGEHQERYRRTSGEDMENIGVTMEQLRSNLGATYTEHRYNLGIC